METGDFRDGAPSREGTSSRTVSTCRGRGTNRGGAISRVGATSRGGSDSDFRQYQTFSMLHGNFSGSTRGNFRGTSRPSTSSGSLPERDVVHKPNSGETDDSSYGGKYNESAETSQEGDTFNDESAKGSDGPTEAIHTVDVDNDPQNAEGFITPRTLREGRYRGVINYLLHCFVCNKNMTDGESFHTHIYGKAHRKMLNNLKEIFQNIISMLREHISLDEEKKIIELERWYRNMATYNMPKQECISYCKMCDWTFFGEINDHRMTEGHRRLKKFLHPLCIYCDEHFSSRLKWVTHHFTPNHLRKVTEIKLHDEDDIPLIDKISEIDNDLSSDDSLESEDEITDNLRDFYNGIPAYKPTQAVGKKHLKFVSGFYCDLCVCFLMDERAMQNHLQSEKHYHAFVAAANAKVKKMQNEKKEKEMQKCRRSEEEADKTENPTSVKFEEANGNDDEDYYSKEIYQANIVYLDEIPNDQEFAESIDLIQAVVEDNDSQGEHVISPDNDDSKETYQVNVVSLDEIPDDQEFAESIDLIQAVGDENNSQGEDVVSADHDEPEEVCQDASLDKTSEGEELLDCNDDEDKVQDENQVQDENNVQDEDKVQDANKVQDEDIAEDDVWFAIPEPFPNMKDQVMNLVGIDRLHLAQVAQKKWEQYIKGLFVITTMIVLTIASFN
ncbi:hypothetical protein FQA39_LY09132 [Lamprigera yunnana]|nr:hypothetical protein FQA39_LY09132 [Lamprigera yunnana]